MKQAVFGGVMGVLVLIGLFVASRAEGGFGIAGWVLTGIGVVALLALAHQMTDYSGRR